MGGETERDVMICNKGVGEKERDQSWKSLLLPPVPQEQPKKWVAMKVQDLLLFPCVKVATVEVVEG